MRLRSMRVRLTAWYLAMLACGLLNVMIERVAYRPLRNAPKLAPLITAVGFAFILEDVGQLWLGGNQQGVPDLIRGQAMRDDLERLIGLD